MLMTGGRCEKCAYKPPNTLELELDHIRAISAGGRPFDPANVRLLCRDCHKRKSVESGDYARTSNPRSEIYARFKPRGRR